MEALTRLVADSLARHGLDRPIDPRRLQWSRWFRCDSPHSLLTVPSKPGIFALAEEVLDLGTPHVGTDAFVRPPDQSSAAAEPKRMLAVLQFSEDDDMAFTLDRMFTRINPMRERLASGRCFLRFVVIQDQEQRRSICSALNQWMRNSAEKASGIGADFQSSLEFTTDRVGRTLLSDNADAATAHVGTDAACPEQSRRVRPPDSVVKPVPVPPPQPSISSALDSGSNKNLHCPHPLPSGF
jgi:hypothetical protein